MTKHAILNNIEHANLKVKSLNNLTPAAQQMCVSLTISELRPANRNLVIVYYYENQQYHPMALLGFEKDENLYVSDTGWIGGYQPAILQKGPFSVGKTLNDEQQEQLIISVDMDDARVNEVDGQPAFLVFGGQSDYLIHITNLLEKLYTEREPTLAYCQALNSLDLFEPLTLNFETAPEHGLSVSGFYVINEEKLVNLPGKQLATLSQSGYLMYAYMSIASLSNLSALIDVKLSKSNACKKVTR